MEKPDIEKIRPLIKLAIEEDLGRGDVTTSLFFKDDTSAKANIVSRREIIVCGMDIAAEVFRCYNENLKLKVIVNDGAPAGANDKIAEIEGPLRSMLSAERVALNFLQRLSGIATTTHKFVQAVAGTEAKIYDTRKTTPGLRLLEKYAVRGGGGRNHRLGLYDAVLIKDNHLAQFGDNLYSKLSNAVAEAKNLKDINFIAVEVDNIDEQLEDVLKIAGIDVVLLDNIEPSQLKRAVEMRNTICGKGKKPLLEASGKITLDNVLDIAACGIDRIAVGTITHSAAAADIGLDR